MKNYIKLIVCGLCIISIRYDIFAQPICQIQHFSAYNGLAQRTVTDIAQDPKGFIWFSTWNGLNKFDGYTFENYKAYPGDGCTLTSNRLSGIVSNQQSNIWCQTYDNKVYLFDSRNKEFIDILQPIEKRTKRTYIVRKIYALSKGISWIVFDNGAFRIDDKIYQSGENYEKSITIYSPEMKNLPSGEIFNIKQDADGDEWIFTNKGIHIIGKKAMSVNIIFKESCENKRKMYMTSADNRLAIYDYQTKQVVFKKIPFSYSKLNSIQSLGNDTIGIGTDHGAIFFLAKKQQFKHVDTKTVSQLSSDVLKIFKDRYNEIWMFSYVCGVTRYNPSTGEKQYYQTPPQNMPNAERKSRDVIFEDNLGTLWVVPHLGCLSYYDRECKQLKPYYTDYNNSGSKFTPVILDYYLDNQNNFWYVNSYEMGKISFYPNACRLTHLDDGFETRAFLIDRHKRLWVSNKKGIIRIYNSDKSIKGYLTPEGNISSKAISFSRNIYCFMEDSQGYIWMGSKWDGIFRLREIKNGNFQIQRFSHREDDPYSLSNNSVYSVYQDSQKHIWIGTYGGGLNLFQEMPEGKARFLNRENLFESYPKDKFSRVRIIKEVNHALLIGTTEGLLSLSCNFKRPECIKFYHNVRIPNKISSLSSNDVTHIYTDSRKKTYVLTFTGGVNQILSKNLLSNQIQFKTYTKKNGLLSDLALSMIEDKQKNLWIISENTLTKFNPKTETFEKYGERYLQNKLYFSEAIPVQSQDQLILGTDAGILRINPSLFHKSTYIPPIVFTGLKIQGVQQYPNINDLKELKLKPNERNISFQFSALDYIDPTAISYAYRLKGLEEKWNEVDNSRTANYINLPPGNYELQIRSTNSDGIWAENIRKLTIIVLPTFGETYWAILFYIILAILSVAIAVHIITYIYRLRHKIIIEQQLVDLKLRFFTDISHELRTPLTLITSPVSEVLEHESLSPNGRRHLTLVYRNTERMLRLINQILDFCKIENKKMKLLLEETEVITLLQKIMDNFNLIAEEKNIKYKLQSRQNAIYAWIDQDKFEKIISNLLSNAFKYTSANKSITVYIDIEKDKLLITIADEGIGIDPKKQESLFQRFETLVRYNIMQPSSGIGLSLVKELVELHQGSIQVNSQTGIGSEFTITLPLDQNKYKENENAEFILEDLSASGKEQKENNKDVDTTFDDEKEIGKDSINQTKISILIVEDNAELRSFLKDILSETYNVIEATNGEEGLKYTFEYVPDFIISDIMMPVMDGLDMVRVIKEDRNICHIPIILLSAKSSLDDRISGLEQGIDDYITKPFSSSYLKIRIKSLLHQRKQLQELYLKQWSEMQKENSAPITNIEPSQPQITPFDKQFMSKVMEVIERQMDNPDLTIEEFAQQLNMGRTVFYQKLKTIVGLSPVDFIREIRIKRAKQLIDSGEYNISTVAYMTGFNDPKYFSKCFKKKYGTTPSEYYKEKKRDV